MRESAHPNGISYVFLCWGLVLEFPRPILEGWISLIVGNSFSEWRFVERGPLSVFSQTRISSLLTGLKYILPLLMFVFQREQRPPRQGDSIPLSPLWRCNEVSDPIIWKNCPFNVSPKHWDCCISTLIPVFRRWGIKNAFILQNPIRNSVTSYIRLARYLSYLL